MVDAVLRRRVEDPLEDPELPAQLGVDPELVQRRERFDRRKDQRRHAQERKRQVEGEDGPGRKHGLAQGDRQVEVLALVVHRMNRPEEVHAVAHAVPDVIGEVDRNERDQPRPGRARLEEPVSVHPQVCGGENAYAEDDGNLLRHPAGEIDQRVVEAVGAHAAAPHPEDLHAHEQEEEGDGEGDVVRHLCPGPGIVGPGPR